MWVILEVTAGSSAQARVRSSAQTGLGGLGGLEALSAQSLSLEGILLSICLSEELSWKAEFKRQCEAKVSEYKQVGGQVLGAGHRLTG